MAESHATPPTGNAAATRRTPHHDDAPSTNGVPAHGERRSFAAEAHETTRKASDELVGAARDISQTTAQATRELGERSRKATREAAANWRGAMEPFFGLPMEMNRWLGELWGQAGAESFSGLRPARPFAAWSMAPLLGLPPADVKETQDAYKLCIELPGLTRADIDLQMRGDMLVVSGQKAEDRDDASAAYRVSERRFGRFERRFPIPPEVKREGIDAAFRDGVLTITLPKSAEAAREQNRIEIKGA